MALPRIVIDDVRPRTSTGRYPAKAVVGELVPVTADIFRDGHDVLASRVRWRPVDKPSWEEAPLTEAGDDRWAGVIEPTTLGMHEIVVQAWTDAYATWRHKLEAKLAADVDVDVELEEGARLFETRGRKLQGDERRVLTEAAIALRAGSPAPALAPEVAPLVTGPARSSDVTGSRAQLLWVDRERALVGAWYEVFPRSEGGLAGVGEHLADVAAMGFDVLYLPPIHPIGRSYRKGADNTLAAGPDDPGSPWAIGGPEGGHEAVHPDLGTIADFDALVARAGTEGLEIALDYALQCSPDHPWVREHPEWFHHRPDGTIAYAENPPKKYQDIYPINFWPEKEADRHALWNAAKGILDHWISHGVRIFRVDNPHTKPIAFWEWLLPAVQADHPEVLFLAEAFTRPKMMAKLAEVGFSQSYTYFTWRTEKWELEEYLAELAHGPKADFMRPNFWPNTPDILSGPLRDGPRAAFKQRLVLAATLVPSYGVYRGYEFCENAPASDDNEEYLHSEKYELRARPWHGGLVPYMTRLNSIRRQHPALQRLRNIAFQGADNEHIIAYAKVSDDGTDVVLVVVNLDPWNAQACTLGLDLPALGLPVDGPYEAHDELSGQTFPWWGANPYVRLDPAVEPAHILHLRPAPAP